MRSEVMKWAIVGLVCAVVTMGILGGGIYIAFQYSMRTALNGADGDSSISGAEEWQEDRNDSEEEAAAIDREIRSLGLDRLYQIVYSVDDSRHELYHHKNFDLVRDRLNKQRATAGTPLERHRYGQHISSIASLHYDEDPLLLLGTLDEWVAHDPESHLPWLIRGAFKLEYAWYFRGAGWIHEVSRQDLKKYDTFSRQAKDDLTKASELNPDDPEPFAHLVQAAGDTGENLDVLRKYFDQTLALYPQHINVRATMINYARPEWYGSWAMMDALVEECETASKEFPMLMWVSRMAVGRMMDRSEAYEARWDAPETAKKWADAWNAQVEQTPEDVHVLADAAYFSAHAGDLATATRHFRKLGNRFPDVSEFSGIPEFHRWRIYAYLTTLREPDIAGTEQERTLLDELLAFAPTNPGASIRYLEYLVRQRDETQTMAFHATCRDAYLATGAWGNPPDFTVMDGMTKAGNSYVWGSEDPQRAAELRDEALVLAPDNAFVRLVHAEHHISNKMFDDARVHLEMARELDPDYLPALHIMGWLNYHQKRWDEGIACAQQFLDSGPSEYLTQFGDDAREIVELCEKKKME